jgi:RNA polymerase sigma factor (sigma-70 family)
MHDALTGELVASFSEPTRRSRFLRRAAFRGFRREDVEDAFQEALAVALTRCRARDPRGVETFLHQATLNRLIDGARRHTRVALSDDVAALAEATPTARESAGDVLEPGWEEELAEELARLPVRTQAILSLRFARDLGYHAIAERIAVSRRIVQRDVVKGLRLVEAFVLDRASDGSHCPEYERDVVAYALWPRSDARAVRASAHLDACGRCQAFHGRLRAVRFGAGALLPVPALPLPGASALNRLADSAASLAENARTALHSVFARMPGVDASPVYASARPGAAAYAIAGCLALVGGGASYCATNGIPDAVKGPLPGFQSERERENERRARISRRVADALRQPPAPSPAPPRVSSTTRPRRPAAARRRDRAVRRPPVTRSAPAPASTPAPTPSPAPPVSGGAPQQQQSPPAPSSPPPASSGGGGGEFF